MRRARKPHECGECDRFIFVGEPYEYATGLSVDSDTWYTNHTCAHCIAARSFLIKECNGYLMQGVLEDLEEHWQEDTLYRSHWLGRAILGIRRKWRKRDGSLMPVPAPHESRVAA